MSLINQRFRIHIELKNHSESNFPYEVVIKSDKQTSAAKWNLTPKNGCWALIYGTKSLIIRTIRWMNLSQWTLSIMDVLMCSRMRPGVEEKIPFMTAARAGRDRRVALSSINVCIRKTQLCSLCTTAQQLFHLREWQITTSLQRVHSSSWLN